MNNIKSFICSLLGHVPRDFRGTGTGFLKAAVAACLAIALCSCVKEEPPFEPKQAPPSPETADGGNSAPGIDTSLPNTVPETPQQPPPTGLDCDGLLKKSVKVFRGIPEDLRSLQTKQANQLATLVEKAVVDCEKYLADCTTDPAAAEVHFYQAKFLQVLSSRVRTQVINEIAAKGDKFTTGELDRKMGPFYRRIASHAVKATDGLARESRLKPQAIEIRAWSHTLLKETRKAKEDYLLFLKTYPASPRSTVLTAALGRVLSTLGEYDAGIKLIEEKMADPEANRSADFPTLGETRWKLYEAKGDPEGLLLSAEKVLKDYRPRIKSDQHSPQTKEAYARYLAFNGFRKGYALMALGRLDEARVAFDEHLNEINQLQEALEKKGLSLKPAISIYRQRSENAQGFLDKTSLRQAPADFDLGEMWVTEKKTRLANSNGKVIGLLFRGTDDTRSATFMNNIAQFASEDNDIELVSVHFFKSARNVDEQLDGLRHELAGMGYSAAAGFDPDLKDKGLFRAWGVYVGSATFLIIDKQGQPVWFQQDPRTRDSNLVKSILLRVRDSG